MCLSTGDNLLVKREHLVLLLRFNETSRKRHSYFNIFFLTASTKTKEGTFFPKLSKSGHLGQRYDVYTSLEVKCFLSFVAVKARNTA